MGADHINDGTDANAETVEEEPDKRPPPPPDKPGTDGYPSRADSRIGAAAANDTNTQTTDDVPEQKDSETGLGKRTDAPGQRLERPADEAESGDDGKAEGAGSAGVRPLGDRLMVDDKPIHDRIDPLGAADVDTDLVTKPWTDPADHSPTGEELPSMESDKLSRFERLRREGYRKIDDGLDVTKKGFDLGVGAFARPPTHAETRTARPEVVEAPHQGVTAGEAATGLLAAGIVIGELMRWGHGKLTDEKERS